MKGDENMDGQRLKKKRKELGLSGEAIAKALETTKVTVSRWENGTSEPSDKKKAILARVLHTSVAYLMGETDNPEPIATNVVAHSQQEDNQQPTSYAYWGGVVDEVHKLIARGDEQEISSIAPLIKLAYELLTKKRKPIGSVWAQMPILDGNNNKNTQNIHVATN